MDNLVPEKLNQLAIRLGLKSSGSLTRARSTLSSENDNDIILIVEDDQANTRVFAKILTKRGGYHVLHTEDVEEVLTLAESGKISIILMDVSLTYSVYQGRAVDGIQITRVLKSNPKTALIPVVLVTAHAMKGDRENFLNKSGADGYIAKPFVDHQEFVEYIKYFILLSKNNKLRNNLIKPKKRIEELKTNVNKSTKKQLKSSKSNSLDLVEESDSLTNSCNQQNIRDKKHEMYQIICADVAHSLKGEFLNIGGSNEEIRYLSNNSPEILEECELIKRSLEHSQIRLQMLIDYLNLGKQKMKPIDIEKLIGEVELLSRHRLPSNIKMEVKIQENLKGRTILGNLDQIKSILFELIRNSTKVLHKPDSKIQIFASYENDGLITLSIKDNGSGIEDGLKKKLLKEIVDSESGSGIGLYIINRIIHQIGGDLKLTSSEEGTTITLVFNES